MSYTAEGMVALVDQYRADLFSRPQTVINDAARTYDEIHAYAAALAAQPNTPPGFVLVPAALLQEIDYAKHHGWPSESCARLELFAAAPSPAPEGT